MVKQAHGGKICECPSHLSGTQSVGVLRRFAQLESQQREQSPTPNQSSSGWGRSWSGEGKAWAEELSMRGGHPYPYHLQWCVSGPEQTITWKDGITEWRELQERHTQNCMRYWSFFRESKVRQKSLYNSWRQVEYVKLRGGRWFNRRRKSNHFNMN